MLPLMPHVKFDLHWSGNSYLTFYESVSHAPFDGTTSVMHGSFDCTTNFPLNPSDDASGAAHTCAAQLMGNCSHCLLLFMACVAFSALSFWCHQKGHG